MAGFGRFLQGAALVVLPVLAFEHWNRQVWLFASLGFSASLFLIGRVIEGYAQR